MTNVIAKCTKTTRQGVLMATTAAILLSPIMVNNVWAAGVPGNATASTPNAPIYEGYTYPPCEFYPNTNIPMNPDCYQFIDQQAGLPTGRALPVWFGGTVDQGSGLVNTALPQGPAVMPPN